MRGCHEKRAPEKFTAWLALAGPDWTPSYPFDGPHVRGAVVDALFAAQRGLCVYCGRRLHTDQPGRFHIEHFFPQSRYPHLSVDFANLFLSCGPELEDGMSSETCGHAKADWYDETASIEPDYPACAHRFRFCRTGEVEPEARSDAAAAVMIRILNLSHREFMKDRKDILELIDGETLELSDFFDCASGVAQSYAHVVFRHLGKVIP